jgi:ribosomal protein S12 methylthiotransferase
VYPYPHVDDVIPLMAEGRILPYLDIPFQHANARLLKLMKRPAGGEKILDRLQQWRTVCPELVIRSTFIVGFPGETEEEFEELLSFLKEAQLDRVGAFAYSPVEGAAANQLPNPVPEEVKQERLARFMACQAEISAEKLRHRIGDTVRVIIDDIDTQHQTLITRSYAEAPEIDGVILVDYANQTPAKIGERIDVDIIATHEHDLVARYADESLE